MEAPHVDAAATGEGDEYNIRRRRPKFGVQSAACIIIIMADFGLNGDTQFMIKFE